MGSYEDQNSYFGVWYIGKLLDEMRLKKQRNTQTKNNLYSIRERTEKWTDFAINLNNLLSQTTCLMFKLDPNLPAARNKKKGKTLLKKEKWKSQSGNVNHDDKFSATSEPSVCQKYTGLY